MKFLKYPVLFVTLFLTGSHWRQYALPTLNFIKHHVGDKEHHLKLPAAYKT